MTAPQEIVAFSALFPTVINEQADPQSVAAFGDTAAQTVTTLERMEAVLAEVGMSLENLVSMRVYLVADPALGKMDFAGFNGACRAFFNAGDKSHFPARTVLQAAGLVNPGWLIEIEAVAAR